MTAASSRIVALDAARGWAVVAMVAFHLIWDLGNFGYIHRDIPYSLGVKLLGHAIAIAFLVISGVSLVLAREKAVGWRPFWRRFFIVGGAAGLVSLGTWLVFPQAFVFFGILHCIAIASLLAAPLLIMPWPTTLLAAIAISIAPVMFSSPSFNTPWLAWIGFPTLEPLTYDYRPLAPWSGALFAGVAAAQFWRARALPAFGAGFKKGAPSWLGRHSLGIYLLHQPALFGVFSLLAVLGAAPSGKDTSDFVDACVSQCEKSGGEAATCLDICACTAEQAARSDILSTTNDTNKRAQRVNQMAQDCMAKGR